MAIAKPPTYRVRKSAAPKATRAPVTDIQSSGTVGSYLPPAPKKIAPAPAPSPFTNPSSPAAQAPATPIAPPETLSGADQRIDASTGYGTSLADINRRILQAALAYGGTDNVSLGGLDASGNDTMTSQGVVKDPNSAIAVAERQLADTTRSTNEDLNNRNSFFSGAHLEQQGKLNDVASRAREAAKTAYDQAMGELMTQLTTARGARDSANRAADFTDIQAATAATPQAEAPSATAPTSAPAAAAKAYTEVPGTAKSGALGVWHVYSDGRPPQFVEKTPAPSKTAKAKKK